MKDSQQQAAPGTRAEPCATEAAPGPTMLEGVARAIGPRALRRKLLRRRAARAAAGAGSAAGAMEGSAEQVAEAGLCGAAQPLPHLDAVQRSFGGAHDVASVRSYQGPDATAASQALSAHAYTFGDQVGFAHAPDLHTAAHEAAHVVQQRSGLHLKSGLSEPGDASEQHADAVADRVVRGESAADLLPGGDAAGPAAGAIQRKEETAEGSRANAAPGEPDSDAKEYGGVARSVARHKTWLVSDPSRYAETLVTKLARHTVVGLVDLGEGEPFNKVKDANLKWWKVKVLSGADSDKEGWVMQHLLASLYEVKDAGQRGHKGKVGDGQVEVRTGEEIDAGGGAFGDNMFSLKYKGPDASDARWLQFIWREIIKVDDKGGSTPRAGNVTTTGGTYALTQGGKKDAFGTPAKANYNTDSISKSDPFYEAGGAADRTADSTTMMDQPSPLTTEIKDAFAPADVKSVVSRAHFHTFLLKARKVTFGTHIDVQWSYASKAEADTQKKGAHTVSGSGAAEELPGTIRERFHEQFPAFKDIK